MNERVLQADINDLMASIETGKARADRRLYPCEGCGSEYVSPLAAGECCDPFWDGRGRE